MALAGQMLIMEVLLYLLVLTSSVLLSHICFVELGVDTLNKALVAPSAYYVVLLCYVIKYVLKKISIEKKINESENDACMRQEWH